MLKFQYLKAFFLILFIFLSYYGFQMQNQKFHTLDKLEFDVNIYQLDANHEWVKYKKDINGSAQLKKREIKSVLSFKRGGSLFLNFSFIKDINGSIAYAVLHNNKEVDAFNLMKEMKHQTHLEVMVGDEVQIEVSIDALEGDYWGTLNSSFKLSPLYLDDLAILLLWILFVLFLWYKNYGYLAILSYAIFSLMVMSEASNFEQLSFKILLSYTFLTLLLTTLFLGIYQIFSSVKKFKVASIIIISLSALFITTPLLFLLYSLNFDHALSPEALYAIFQSNSNESFEYIDKFISFKYLLLSIFTYLFMGFLIYRQEKILVSKINSFLLLLSIVGFGVMSYLNLENLRLGNFVVEHFEKYHKELRLFKEVQAKREAGTIAFNATKLSHGETHIVVIGESLNKNHMGIYGYLRDTTPHLSKMLKERKLLLFTNTYSNHTHTVPVLSFALTEANQYNGKNYYESLSIIEILKKAEVESYWLTNQNIYGEWDNMVSVLATEADRLVAMNHTIGCSLSTQQYDEVLIGQLKKVLAQKSSKNRVIFIHLMGSHSSYGSRYPNDRFSNFTKDLDRTLFGKTAKINQELNRYDNTVVYNDYVVSSILKMLQKEKGVASFLYLSDHTDDINRDLGHSKDFFTYEMTEIPFLAWFSSEYVHKYPQKYGQLLRHKDTLFSNDMLYDTLIGIFNIKTDRYREKYDLSSNSYQLKPKDALVMHGKRAYIHATNRKYWQKRSIEYLKKEKLMKRVTLLDINTTGAKYEALRDGFSSLCIEEGVNLISRELEVIPLSDVHFIEKISKKIQENNSSKIYLNYASDFSL